MYPASRQKEAIGRVCLESSLFITLLPEPGPSPAWPRTAHCVGGRYTYIEGGDVGTAFPIFEKLKAALAADRKRKEAGK